MDSEEMEDSRPWIGQDQSPGERNQIHVAEEQSGKRQLVRWTDGPMPSHLFSAHCSGGSIVSKHWRRVQMDARGGTRTQVDHRPVLLLGERACGVMADVDTSFTRND